MKQSINLLILLFTLVGCNPGSIDSYPKIDDARMEYLNSEVQYAGTGSVEQCEQLPTPGTEDATTIATTFSVKSCDKICKDNYQALPTNYNPDNYLAFPVPGYLGIGRCRGHAIVTQQFSMLAVWDKAEKPEKCGPANMTRECLSMYREIIGDITSGEKVREVPGFKSLLQFSAHPMIKDMIYQKVISYSHRYSAGAGYTEPKTTNQTLNTFYELFKRAKNNQRPYVGIKTFAEVDHAILIERAAYLEGEQILCVSDPNQRNYESFKNHPCANYIKIRNNRPIYVKNGNESSLTKFNVFEDEDFRSLKYVKAWKERCISLALQNQECRTEDLLPVSSAQSLKSLPISAEKTSGDQK